jgi:hypothetical protein
MPQVVKTQVFDRQLHASAGERCFYGIGVVGKVGAVRKRLGLAP